MSTVKMNLGGTQDKIEKEDCDRLSMIWERKGRVSNTLEEMTCKQFLEFHEERKHPRYDPMDTEGRTKEFLIGSDDMGLWGDTIHVKGLPEIIEVIDKEGFGAISLNDYRALINLSCIEVRYEGKARFRHNTWGNKSEPFEFVYKCEYCDKDALLINESGEVTCLEHFKGKGLVGLRNWYLIHNIFDVKNKESLKNVHAKINNLAEVNKVKIDKRTLEGKTAIVEFKGDYEFLEMNYEIPVEYLGYTYRNAQSALCAQKVNKDVYSSAISKLSGEEALELTKNIPSCVDWQEVEYGVLFNVIYCKFKQNEDIAKLLLDTESRIIAFKKKGKDILGMTLMAVRATLRSEKDPSK